MEIIGVFDRMISPKDVLWSGNMTVAPKGQEKTIQNFILTLGKQWKKQEIKRYMKDQYFDDDFTDRENVNEHLQTLYFIEMDEDTQAGFLVGFIWGKLYPNPPRNPRLKKLLNETIRELKKADVLPKRKGGSHGKI
jgi:hypothetical protein